MKYWKEKESNPVEKMEFWKGEYITKLEPNEIFVMGTNPSGIHGAGAAKAGLKFGAKILQGRGLVGSTYGLITKNLEGKEGFVEKATGIVYHKAGFRSVSPEQIRDNIDEMYAVARQPEHKDKKFLITYQYNTWANGSPKKSLNGYDSQEILELFAKDKDVPPNIVFHESYKPHLEKLYKKENKQSAGELVVYENDKTIDIKEEDIVWTINEDERNPQGINGAGAAKAAMSLSQGAKNGIGRGFNGSNAYALVTKSLNAGVFEKSTGILYDKEGFRSVSPEQIRANVDELYEIARQSEHKNKKFLVSYQYESWPNGTPKKSLNGYDSQEVLEMFVKDKDVPPNIIFHESYKPHLEKLYKNKYSVDKKIEQPCKKYHVLSNLVVISPREKAPEGFIVLNTTSKDTTTFGKSVSPFYLSNIPLYEGMVAKNMENAWQFAKVYPEFVDANSNPSEDYFKWAKKGWDDLYAHRYANGKGNVPLYSYWKTFDEHSQQWIEHKWDYIEARKNIYIPLYAKAIVNTQAFQDLKNRVLSGEKIALWDFDGYNHATRNMSFEDVINEPKYKCGHAFVLYGLLTNQLKIINDQLFYDFDLKLNTLDFTSEESSKFIKIDPLSNLYPSNFIFRNIQFSSLEQFVIYAKAKLCENNNVALDVLKINENKIVKDFLNNTVSSEAIINDKELSQEWMEVQKKLQSMCVKIEESPSQKKSWDLKKENIISVGLREKFIQNPDLKNMLLTKENINVVFSGLCYNNININEILQNLKDWIVIESKSKNKPKM